jgi:thioesterase domain-containing protein
MLHPLRSAAALARGDRLLQSWPRGFDDPWDQAGAQRISQHYRASLVAAPVTILYTSGSEILMAGRELGWGRHVAGTITTRWITGDHLSMFAPPDVHNLAAAIAEELSALDA